MHYTLKQFRPEMVRNLLQNDLEVGQSDAEFDVQIHVLSTAARLQPVDQNTYLLLS